MGQILVIDDEKDILEVIEMYLEDSGHKIISHNCAVEALDWAQSNQIDLVITDILMPKMSGLEFITEIQKLRPDIQIVAISGGGENGGIVKDLFLSTAMDLGAQNILRKPFTKVELVSTVSKLI